MTSPVDCVKPLPVKNSNSPPNSSGVQVLVRFTRDMKDRNMHIQGWAGIKNGPPGFVEQIDYPRFWLATNHQFVEVVLGIRHFRDAGIFCSRWPSCLRPCRKCSRLHLLSDQTC